MNSEQHHRMVVVFENPDHHSRVPNHQSEIQDHRHHSFRYRRWTFDSVRQEFRVSASAVRDDSPGETPAAT